MEEGQIELKELEEKTRAYTQEQEDEQKQLDAINKAAAIKQLRK